MEIWFTNKCKEKILYGKEGTKFAIKGYAFYTNTLPDKETGSEEEDAKLLNTSDFEDKYLILNEYKTGTLIKDILFDTTYIPAMESNLTETNSENDTETYIGNFGIYDFHINKGLFKTIPDRPIKYVLIFGEELDETKEYTIDLDKIYLAAIIKPDNDIVITNNTSFSPIKYILQIGLSDIIEKPSEYCVKVDETFNNITLNEVPKNINTIKLDENLILTPDDRNNNYSDELKLIDKNAKVKYESINFDVIDNTTKINNDWNLKPRFFIGIDRPKTTKKPHLQLSHYAVNNNNKTVDINTLSFNYCPEKGYFTVSNDTGIDNLQIDIFPEDIIEENKHCIKERIKDKNTTVNYSTYSGAKNFLKFDSHNSTYSVLDFRNNIEYKCRNNYFYADHATIYNSTFIYSNNNKLLEQPDRMSYLGDNLYINSNNNTLKQINVELLFINSNNNNLIDTYSTTNAHDTFINSNGFNKINENADKQDYNKGMEYCTIIGNNKNSTVTYRPKCTYLVLDKTYNVKGTFNNTTTDKFNSNVNLNLYANNVFPYYLINQTLIGFNGLTMDKNPAYEYFYPYKKQIGYSNEFKDYEVYYYETNTTKIKSQENKNATIVFGNYNANNTLTGISGISDLTIKDYMSLNGTDIESTSDTFTSYYNTAYQYTTNLSQTGDYKLPANLYKLYFNHSQDSIFANGSAIKNVVYSGLWKDLKSDEGDFAINKIVVVGNGVGYKDESLPGYSQAEFASKFTDYDNICKRLDLFSIEKDSYQLVHNGTFDLNPHYSATEVMHLPGTFAVRGIDELTQQYNYHFISGYSANSQNVNEKFINKELYESLNEYNLHNSFYTPSGIFIPLNRSSNDVYKLYHKNLKGLIKGQIIPANKLLNYGGLSNLLNIKSNMYVLNTSGLTFKYLNGSIAKGKGKGKGKGSAGARYEYKTLHDFNMNNLIEWYTQQNIFIPNNGLNGIDNTVYTFYIINNNPYKGLNIKGFRLNKHGDSVQTLYKTKNIPKGHCLRVDYMDCGTKGRYGVMNFDYWNKVSNTYYT